MATLALPGAALDYMGGGVLRVRSSATGRPHPLSPAQLLPAWRGAVLGDLHLSHCCYSSQAADGLALRQPPNASHAYEMSTVARWASVRGGGSTNAIWSTAFMRNGVGPAPDGAQLCMWLVCRGAFARRKGNSSCLQHVAAKEHTVAATRHCTQLHGVQQERGGRTSGSRSLGPAFSSNAAG